jgi:dihydrofolate synthase / folylpolyglutamate synthase
MVTAPASPGAAEILGRLETFGIRLGLATIRALLAAFGHPEERFASVLVAGTNGKGSVSALLASMAAAAGYRVGHYTSPHLEEVEERIRIGGRVIDPRRLAELLGRVVGAAERTCGHPPTYFEAVTAAAFLHFAAEEVELAVVEVGMGGRLDATNALEPVLSLISPVGMDHREHLGETVAAIAGEKAGILRAGRPAICWPGGEEAAAAIGAAARAVGAELVLAPRRVRLASRGEGLAGQRIRLTTPERSYRLWLPLLGAHQADNLALAVLAAEALARRGFPRLDAAAVTAGTAACRWPGRLEPVTLPGGRRLLLDAAHNPPGVAALAAFLAGLGEPWDLLFGTFADKEAAVMLPPLAGGAERVVLTRPPGLRGREPAELAALVPPGRAVVEPDPERALTAALAGTNLLLITGSVYLVGLLRQRLRERLGVPAPATDPLFGSR